MVVRYRLNLFLNLLLIVLQLIAIFMRIRIRMLYVDNSSVTSFSPSLHSFSVIPPMNFVLLLGLVSNFFLLLYTKRSDTLAYVLLFLLHLVFYFRTLILFRYAPLVELPNVAVSPFYLLAETDLLLFNSIHVLFSAILFYLTIDSLIRHEGTSRSGYGFQNAVLMFVFIVHATRMDRTLFYFGLHVPREMLLSVLMIFPFFLIFHGGFRTFYITVLHQVTEFAEGNGWRIGLLTPFIVGVCFSTSIILIIIVVFIINSTMGSAFFPDFAFLGLPLILFFTIVSLLSTPPQRRKSMVKTPTFPYQKGVVIAIVLLLLTGTLGFQLSAVSSENTSAMYTIFNGTIQGSTITGRLSFTNTFIGASDELHYVYYDRVILFEFDFESSVFLPLACLEITKVTIDGEEFVNETLMVKDEQILSLQLNESIVSNFSQPVFVSLGINSAGACFFSTLPSSVVSAITT
ncbi:MAG: hypothetical protein D6732_12085 [Methanobacteriota archaeon]|nr:MAG: hypothetical protein D6732_12085 [Euryarchaeota archaeon]